MIFRLPFYTAIADVGIDIVGILNVSHTAIDARVWDQPMCSILSVLYFFFITINLALYGTVSMTTYLRVCRQFYFDLGKFDYKLWLVIIAIAAVFQLIAGPYYGARKYWCAAQANNIIIPIVCFTLISLIFLLVIFCYISILKTLLGHAMEFQIDKNNIDEKDVKLKNNNPGSELARTRSSLEKRVSNKIISYVLVFILQWTPVQIFCAAKFFDIDSTWIYVVCVIGINFGGLGNAIQYILNEGWHPRNVDPNVSWSFAESPSRFIKRFYPNSQNMHTPSSISSLPSSRPPSSSTISVCVRNSQQINNKMNHNNKNYNSNNNSNSNINHNNNSIIGSINDNNNDDNNSYYHRIFYYNHHHSSSTISSPHFCAYKTFDKYGATNSICSDFLNNANNSSNNSVKELNSNPYNIEINIDINNFVTESEMALSKVKIKEK
ncbi:hypothetical protein C2G38_2081284 [Gigaspora rosea]|uniref:G-protein coupled receptors family 1 profile domain-containing protein n=1 Tax=Gigaspora rosea TaxID=44941 RepID=A0A397VE54_9GLOM|nr:hypothetical protein C2G38_2081284 [Gigaspora rosea]